MQRYLLTLKEHSMHISLEISLRNGDKKVFPLTHRASDYQQAGSWHETLLPHMNRLGEVHLEMFTGDVSAWETVLYHYLEGLTSSGDVEADDFEEDKGYKYAWQMLLNDKPATYAEIDQDLNCDFWLHIESSRETEGDLSSIPLDRGQWAIDAEGKYYLDKSVPVLTLADGIYEAAAVDTENGTDEEGTHYGKVLEAIEPIFNRTTECVKATIDGITYTFTLSRCEGFSA